MYKLALVVFLVGCGDGVNEDPDPRDFDGTKQFYCITWSNSRAIYEYRCNDGTGEDVGNTFYDECCDSVANGECAFATTGLPQEQIDDCIEALDAIDLLWHTDATCSAEAMDAAYEACGIDPGTA